MTCGVTVERAPPNANQANFTGHTVNIIKPISILDRIELQFNIRNIICPSIKCLPLIQAIHWGLCNDTITIDAFVSSPFTFAGRQGKGISQLIEDLNDPALHISRASELVSPFSEDISLPAGVLFSIEIDRSIHPNALAASWAKRIESVRQLKVAFDTERAIWYN